MYIHKLCFFTDYCPYYCFTTGSIRLWCRDPSVRSSFSFDRVTRVGSSTSGSFAAKSERTHATISFQCRNFAQCSRGTSARRASKTSNAFFQDTCDVRHQQCSSDRYEMVRTPSSRSKRVCSSTHISRASAAGCSKVESQRVSSPIYVGTILVIALTRSKCFKRIVHMPLKGLYGFSLTLWVVIRAIPLSLTSRMSNIRAFFTIARILTRTWSYLQHRLEGYPSNPAVASPQAVYKEYMVDREIGVLLNSSTPTVQNLPPEC
jgi:hypothetical protein